MREPEPSCRIRRQNVNIQIPLNPPLEKGEEWIGSFQKGEAQHSLFRKGELSHSKHIKRDYTANYECAFIVSGEAEQTHDRTRDRKARRGGAFF